MDEGDLDDLKDLTEEEWLEKFESAADQLLQDAIRFQYQFRMSQLNREHFGQARTAGIASLHLNDSIEWLTLVTLRRDSFLRDRRKDG